MSISAFGATPGSSLKYTVCRLGLFLWVSIFLRIASLMKVQPNIILQFWKCRNEEGKLALFVSRLGAKLITSLKWSI